MTDLHTEKQGLRLAISRIKDPNTRLGMLERLREYDDLVVCLEKCRAAMFDRLCAEIAEQVDE